MLRVFLLLLGTIAGAWYVANTLEEVGPGYVWISYNQYSIETTFWFFCALIALTVLACLIIFSAVKGAIYLLKNLGLLSSNWGVSKAQRQLNDSRVAYVNAQWDVAAKTYKKSLKKASVSFFDVVMAAQAAMRSEDFEQAKALAKKALVMGDASELTLEILNFDIACAEKNWAMANVAMAKLLRNYPKDHGLKIRALEYFVQQRQWAKAAEVLSSLPKAKGQSVKIKMLAEQIYIHQLNSANHIDLFKPFAKTASQYSATLQQAFITKAWLYDASFAEKQLKQLLKKNQLAALTVFNTQTLNEADALVWLNLIEPVKAKIKEFEPVLQAEVIAGIAALNNMANLHNKAIDLYQQSLVLNLSVTVVKQYNQLLVQYKSPEELTALLKQF